MFVGLGDGVGSRGEEERVDPVRIAALLHRIDTLPEDATGALAFDGGVVLVEARRVCWAAARRVQTRLTDRLRQVAHLPPGLLEELFRECRELGAPLGQTLVKRGAVDRDALRNALLDHTSDALAQLATAATDDARWTPVPDRRYDADFTFSTSELLSHASDTYWGPLAEAARAELNRLLENGGVGCAYVAAGDGTPVPVGAHDAEEMGADGILELGKWATKLLQDAKRAAGKAQLVALLENQFGAAAAVWERDGIVYAALFADRSDFANVVIRLRRAEEES